MVTALFWRNKGLQIWAQCVALLREIVDFLKVRGSASSASIGSIGDPGIEFILRKTARIS
jgi:hypothetical protein